MKIQTLLKYTQKGATTLPTRHIMLPLPTASDLYTKQIFVKNSGRYSKKSEMHRHLSHQ